MGWRLAPPAAVWTAPLPSWVSDRTPRAPLHLPTPQDAGGGSPRRVPHHRVAWTEEGQGGAPPAMPGGRQPGFRMMCGRVRSCSSSWRPRPRPQSSLQAQTLLKDQLEFVRQKQPDGTTRYTLKPLEAEFSFDKGFFMFIRAIQLLTQQNKDTTVVRRRAVTARPAVAPAAAPAAQQQPRAAAGRRGWALLPSPHASSMRCAPPCVCRRWAWQAPLAPARPPSPRRSSRSSPAAPCCPWTTTTTAPRSSTATLTVRGAGAWGLWVGGGCRDRQSLIHQPPRCPPVLCLHAALHTHPTHGSHLPLIPFLSQPTAHPCRAPHPTPPHHHQTLASPTTTRCWATSGT